MEIGLKFETNMPISQERERGYSLAHKFSNQFEKKAERLMCRAFIGYDLTNEKEFHKTLELDVFMEDVVFLSKMRLKS